MSQSVKEVYGLLAYLNLLEVEAHCLRNELGSLLDGYLLFLTHRKDKRSGVMVVPCGVNMSLMYVAS